MIFQILGIIVAIFIALFGLSRLPATWRAAILNTIATIFKVTLGVVIRVLKALYTALKVLAVLLIVLFVVHLIVLNRGNSNEITALFAFDFAIGIGLMSAAKTLSKWLKTDGSATKSIILVVIGLATITLVAAKGPDFYQANSFWIWTIVMTLFVLMAIGNYKGVENDWPLYIMAALYFILLASFIPKGRWIDANIKQWQTNSDRASLPKEIDYQLTLAVFEEKSVGYVKKDSVVMVNSKPVDTLVVFTPVDTLWFAEGVTAAVKNHKDKPGQGSNGVDIMLEVQARNKFGDYYGTNVYVPGRKLAFISPLDAPKFAVASDSSYISINYKYTHEVTNVKLVPELGPSRLSMKISPDMRAAKDVLFVETAGIQYQTMPSGNNNVEGVSHRDSTTGLTVYCKDMNGDDIETKTKIYKLENGTTTVWCERP